MVRVLRTLMTCPPLNLSGRLSLPGIRHRLLQLLLVKLIGNFRLL